MANRKVRVGQVFFYVPTLLDRTSPTYAYIPDGTKVRVINLHGAPKANTMGHCYIELLEDEHGNPYEKRPAPRGEPHQPFGGLVCTNSLHTKAEYIEYLHMLVDRPITEDKLGNCRWMTAKEQGMERRKKNVLRRTL